VSGHLVKGGRGNVASARTRHHSLFGFGTRECASSLVMGSRRPGCTQRSTSAKCELAHCPMKSIGVPTAWLAASQIPLPHVVFAAGDDHIQATQPAHRYPFALFLWLIAQRR
jgi:hypothetical protein